MAKIRVTIYIDEEVWGDVKESAWKRRESASSYLEKLIKNGSKSFTDDANLPDVIAEHLKYQAKDLVEPEMTIEDLAKKQAELDEAKANRDIKKSDSFFRPISKDALSWPMGGRKGGDSQSGAIG